MNYSIMLIFFALSVEDDCPVKTGEGRVSSMNYPLQYGNNVDWCARIEGEVNDQKYFR